MKTGKKSVSFLLGAGFSAPKGYPIGKKLNEELLNFDDSKLDFSPDGYLATSNDGTKPKFQIDGVQNIHQKHFEFCKSLINEYFKAHGNKFDYEEFYDFIKTDEVKEERYQSLCKDLLNENETYDNYLKDVTNIYNQMVAHLLKDKDGKTWYDDEPFKIAPYAGYNGFLNYLSQLSSEYIVNIHTLNHDLLFESFNNTEFINGDISDGFDEYGSEYYGLLEHNKRNYHCRLERYTGKYNKPIRLFKLHGSLDYVPFYRKNRNGVMRPEKYIKIRYDIGFSDVKKGRKAKFGYQDSSFEYHADFLTGTTSKIQRYNEPLLFKKLFKRFKNNLQNAEKLIIIGYGCKDAGINDIIKEFFDYKNKPSFIIDAYADEGSDVYSFKNEISAKLHQVEIDKITEKLFE